MSLAYRLERFSCKLPHQLLIAGNHGSHKCWTRPIGGVVPHCVFGRGVVALGGAQSGGAPFFIDKKLIDSDAAIYKRSLEERNATQVFNNRVSWAIKPNPE